MRYVMYYIYVYYNGEEGCFFNIPFQRLIPKSKRITYDMRYYKRNGLEMYVCKVCKNIDIDTDEGRLEYTTDEWKMRHCTQC